MVLKIPTAPKHIGIIGGMGPFAGQRFIQHILEYARDTYGARVDEDYPQMSIENIALPALTAQGVTDGMQYVPLLSSVLKRIETYGAQMIAIPCNTIHSIHAELQKSVAVPLFNIIEETVRRAVSQDYKRTYILGTGSTISDGLYHSALRAQSIEPLQPTGEHQEQVGALITILEQGCSTPEACELYDLLVKEAMAQGADSIILGCTELSYLCNEPTPGISVIDSSRILAEAVVNAAYGASLS